MVERAQRHGLSLIVPVGQNEALRAMTYRDLHDDFEDDLLLAAAARVDADYVVTSDRALLRHAPVACLDPADMRALLRARAAAADAEKNRDYVEAPAHRIAYQAFHQAKRRARL